MRGPQGGRPHARAGSATGCWLALRRDRAGLLCGTALQAATVRVLLRYAAALGVPALLYVPALASAQPAPNARPQGGVVVGGTASIGGDAGTTVISQGSSRAAISWQSFDVGSQQAVRFDQPSASAVTLNQVRGPDPSQIAGRISANGQIILTNRAGVVFHEGAQVNAQSLVVSSAAANPAAFMASGKVAFDAPPLPGAVVENRGTITVAQAGLAALVAPQVRNSGVISARLGRVVLAGSDRHVLDLYGDGMLSIDVTGQVRSLPSARGTATALVTNAGTILAEGGSVLLSARAADGVVQTLVDAGGTVSAPSLPGHPGRVVIAGTGGALVVSGEVLADGAAPGTAGGAVAVVGTGEVSVAAGARISASGPAGGGVVALGTTLARARGGPAIAAKVVAARVSVARGATVAADATASGPGGRVVLLSARSTSLSGAITAHGGQGGGNGGLVEVSGALGLSLDGATDTTAPRGRAGSTLLDPYDLVISTGGSAVAGGTLAASSGGSSNATITPDSIAALSGGVTLQAQHDLTVSSALTITHAITALELDAGHSLQVNAPISLASQGESGASLVLSAAGAVVTAGSLAAGGTLGIGAMLTTVGPITLETGAGGAVVLDAPVIAGVVGGSGSLVAVGSPILVSAGTGGIALGSVLAGRTVWLGTAGTVSETTSAGLTASTLNGQSSNVSLGSTLNAVSAIGSLSTADLVLTQPGPLTIGLLGANAVQIATGPLTVGSLSLANGSSNLSATGSLSLDGPVLLPRGGGTLGLSATGDMVLSSQLTGQYGFAGLFASAGGTLREQGGIDTSAPYLSGVRVALSAGRDLEVDAGIAAVGAVSLSAGRSGTLVLNAPVLAGVTGGSGSFVAAGSPLSLSAGTGGIVLGTAAAASTLSLQTSGPVTQSASSGLTATSLGGTAGAVSLGSTLNAVSAIGSLVADSLALSQPGALSVGTIAASTVQLSVGDLTVDTLLLGRGSSTLRAGGTLSLHGDIQLPTGGGTLGLASVGDMTLATSLNSGYGFGGLTATAGGTLTEYGGIDVSASDLGAASTSLSAGRDLLVYGPIGAAGPVSLAAGPAGELVLDARVGSSPNSESVQGVSQPPVALSAGTGGILLGTAVAASVLTLNTTGPVVQEGSGGVTAASLGGTVGLLLLDGTANAVRTVSSLASLGTLSLATTGPLDLVSASGTSVRVAAGGALAVGTVLAGSGAGGLQLSAGSGNLVVSGTLSGGRVELDAGAGSVLTGTAAAVSAASLGGTARGGSFAIASPGGVIAAVDGVSSTGSFSLSTGNLAARPGGSTSIVPLALGAIAANGVSIAAPDIVADGAGLSASTGAVSLRAGRDLSLGGTYAPSHGVTSLALSAGRNLTQSGTLSTFTQGEAGVAVSLSAGQTLAVAGALSTAGPLLLFGGTQVSLAAPVTAGVVGGSGRLVPVGTLTLSGGSATLAAPVQAGVVTLALSGGINQTPAGSLAATSLGGTAGAVALTGTSNALGTLAGLVATAGDMAVTEGGGLPLGIASLSVLQAGGTLSLLADRLVLAPGASLSASGGSVVLAPASAARPVSLVGTDSGAAGTLEVSQALLGAVVGAATLQVGSAGSGLLSIAPDGIPVRLAASTAPVLGLASGVGVAQDGALSAGTLRLFTPGDAILGAAGNAVATLGGSTVGGALTLADGQGLTVSGPLSVGGTARLQVAGNLALSGPAISVGTLSFGVSGAVTGGTTPLVAASITGTAASILLSAVAPTLSGLSATGLLSVSGRSALSVSGPVGGGTVALSSGGPLAIGGALVAGGTMSLDASGAVTEAGGSVQAATLGVRGASVSLDSPANVVAVLAGSSATAGGFALSTAGGLTVAGPLASHGPASLSAAGSLTVSGAVSAPALALRAGGRIEGDGLADVGTLTGFAASASLSGSVDTLAAFATRAGFSLAVRGPLVVAGPVTDANGVTLSSAGQLTVAGPVMAPTVSLSSLGGASDGIALSAGMLSAPGVLSVATDGALAQSAGAGLSVGTLTGRASAASLSGTLGTLGAFSTGGTLSLDDASPLLVAGPVTAGGLVLGDAGAITLAGTIKAGSLSVRGGDTVRQVSGLLDVGTLDGTAAGLASFGPDDPGPVARVGTLSGFVVSGGGTFSLADAGPLRVTGTLSAHDVALASAGTLTLADVTLRTDGLSLVSQTGPTASLPGSFLAVTPDRAGVAVIAQTGQLTLEPLDTSGTTLRLDLPSTGGTAFLAGLSGPAATLVLSPGGGAIGGTVTVGRLVVLGGSGTVALAGTVAGVAGPGAAGIATALPQPRVAFQLNGCEIGPGCVTPAVQVPPSSPAQPLPAQLPPSQPLPAGPSAAQRRVAQQSAPDSPAAIVASTTAPLVAALQGATQGGLLAVTAQDVLRPDRTLNGILSLSVVPDVTDPDLLLPNISGQDY